MLKCYRQIAIFICEAMMQKCTLTNSRARTLKEGRTIDAAGARPANRAAYGEPDAAELAACGLTLCTRPT